MIPKFSKEQYLFLLGNPYGAQKFTTFLNGHVSTEQFLDFLDRKPVPNTTDSPLATALQLSCSIFSSCKPRKFASVSEIVEVSLLNSNLTFLPEAISTFSNLAILDVSHNPLEDSSAPVLAALLSLRSLTTLR